MTAPSPLLIYDGDCAFCLAWVRYWQALTGDAVRYAPYQQVAADHPQIPHEAFRHAVRYVGTDGRIAAGAEASLLTLAHAPGHRAWLWLYLHLPGFGWLAERMYALVASHRGAAFVVTHWLWGKAPQPAHCVLTARLCLAGLAAIHVAAFASLAVQITGLVGRRGLLPLADYVAALAQRDGPGRWWRVPMLFWLDASDAALQTTAWAGALLSAVLLLGLLRHGTPLRHARWGFGLLFVLWLSLFDAGQTFTNFQWDLLLLEAGALACVLAGRPALFVWTTRWLVFRFMVMSGLVKLAGDPAWLDFSVLRTHFETQPLPTPLAWHAAQLPAGVLAAGGLATLVIELLLPFALLLPRRPRMVAAWATIGLQVAILATGNYGYFNLLALVLCIALFDDAALRRVLPVRWAQKASATQPPPSRIAAVLTVAFAGYSVVVGMLQTVETWRRPPVPDAWTAAADVLLPLHLVNRYGPFSALSHERNEIVLEGWRDGSGWQPIGFRAKPGDVRRAPRWLIPDQPRLDWQLWFAALGTPRENPWITGLVRGVLSNTPEVLRLLGPDPFAGGPPPQQVRLLLDRYRFADAGDRAKGVWWVREPRGIYLPPMVLAPEAPGGIAPAVSEEIQLGPAGVGR